jgi:copper homeostasis protein
MTSPLLEISVESLGAAAAAERGGAHRIELCANLTVGGLTPPATLMRETRQAVRIPIFAMIRARAGDFVYPHAEFARMRREIEVAKACGMNGIVLGILKPDHTVDIDRTRELVECAKPLPVTFHRAFDETPDLHAALEAAIATGAKRVLTSGGKPNAEQGAEVLADLVAAAADLITILPGGGLNAANLAEIIRSTGAREFHSGLGSTLPYGQSSETAFESAVRELRDVLAGACPETKDGRRS